MNEYKKSDGKRSRAAKTRAQHLRTTRRFKAEMRNN